jgi:hypothetical protein
LSPLEEVAHPSNMEPNLVNSFALSAVNRFAVWSLMVFSPLFALNVTVRDGAARVTGDDATDAPESPAVFFATALTV